MNRFGFVVLIALPMQLFAAGDEPSLWPISKMLTTKKYVDLTHAFAPGIPRWPGFPDETRKTIYWYDPPKDGSAAADTHPGLMGVHRPALLTLEQQISVLSAELEGAAPADIPAGVGKLTTVVMTREICSWERFRNRRAISSYTGLCPGEHSSGSKRIPGSVTKHGNPRLRAALVECAWRMVRFQPNYPPVKKRLAILAKGSRATGAQRKKAIVAVARHLAVDLWRIHTGRCSAAQLGLNSAKSLIVREEQKGTLLA